MLGYFALMDLLFLPYFPFFVIPFGLPIIFLSLILSGRRWESRTDLACFVLISVGVLGSTLVSIWLSGIYILENFKRAFQFLSSFVYFFYFLWLGKRGLFKPKLIFYVFVFYFNSLALHFFFDPVGSINMLQAIYPMVGTMASEILMYMRFPYAFSDPNSASYLLLMGAGYIFLTRGLGALPSTILFLATLFGVLVTQSRGGLFALVLVALCVSVKALLGLRKRPDKFVARIVFMGIGLMTFIYILAIFLPTHNLDNFMTLLEERWTPEEDFGGGRGGKYSWAFSSLPLLPIGTGYTMFINNEIFRPHSDVIRITFSYGYLTLFATLIFLFRSFCVSFPVVIPAACAFVFNSLIDDQKLFCLFLVLIALSKTREKFDSCKYSLGAK